MKDDISKIELLEGDIERLIEYLKMKVRLKDWHGVMDVSADLRELDVELRYEKKYPAHNPGINCLSEQEILCSTCRIRL